MKSTGTVMRGFSALAASGLAIGVVVERHAWFKLDQENGALRQQLSQRAQYLAENQRLSNLVARANSPPSRPDVQLASPAATDERVEELLRLRGEVAALRQQGREVEALREDTRRTRRARGDALKSANAGQAARTSSGTTGDGSQLEILKAEYWTAHTNMDVGDELRERVRDDGLKTVASNNIKGDPEFGQVKHLTVVYRFGGVTRTNEFQEGEVVILPPE
jgi:hypothetical protein